jgi:hypothetical protein
MTDKTPNKATPKPEPKIGEKIGEGSLPDGRPYHDIFLDKTRTYRITRIFVSDSDEAWDACQNEDGTINARLNNRMQLVAAIVDPKTGLDDFEKMTAIDLDALFRAYGRLNILPPADLAGNA